MAIGSKFWILEIEGLCDMQNKEYFLDFLFKPLGGLWKSILYLLHRENKGADQLRGCTFVFACSNNNNNNNNNNNDFI